MGDDAEIEEDDMEAMQVQEVDLIDPSEQA
jgi:hypothetical protein